MANELSGADLDARFFEVCWPGQSHVDRKGLYQLSKPHVSTDANACEAWAMRWAREQGFRYGVAELDSKFVVALGSDDNYAEGYGQDWKEAFVRACVAAGEIINKAKGGA